MIKSGNEQKKTQKISYSLLPWFRSLPAKCEKEKLLLETFYPKIHSSNTTSHLLFNSLHLTVHLYVSFSCLIFMQSACTHSARVEHVFSWLNFKDSTRRLVFIWMCTGDQRAPTKLKHANLSFICTCYMDKVSSCGLWQLMGKLKCLCNNLCPIRISFSTYPNKYLLLFEISILFETITDTNGLGFCLICSEWYKSIMILALAFVFRANDNYFMCNYSETRQNNFQKL